MLKIKKEAQDGSDMGGHQTHPPHMSKLNIHVYRDQLLLRDNWGMNEQFLNNKQEKETP